MAKVNMSALNEDGPRTVFIPLNPYRPDCEAGWTVTLADDEEVCPDCRAHPCVDEDYSTWCRTCNENGYIKTTQEEFDNEQ